MEIMAMHRSYMRKSREFSSPIRVARGSFRTRTARKKSWLGFGWNYWFYNGFGKVLVGPSSLLLRATMNNRPLWATLACPGLLALYVLSYA